MRRFIFILFLAGFLFVGGWLLANRQQINGPRDFLRLAGQQISKLGGGAQPWNVPYRQREENVIRIATFNGDNLNSQKTDDIKTAVVLAGIIRQFDVIAIQEIDTTDRFSLKRFLKLVNSTGRSFRTVMGPGASKTGAGQQAAFIYDTTTIELADGQYYNVSDPDNVVTHEPLVGWFRTKTSRSEDAFTFTLVNVHLEPRSASNEMLRINQIFRAVRNDGRQEDDVIIVGDFGVDSGQLNQLAIGQGLQAVNVGMATDTRTSGQFDNLMIDPLATGEFTGDTGVFDFMKVNNLTLKQALAISDHMPVWGEFSVDENGALEQVANVEGAETSR